MPHPARLAFFSTGPISEDAIRGRIAWKSGSSLSALQGKPIRVVFHMKGPGYMPSNLRHKREEPPEIGSSNKASRAWRKSLIYKDLRSLSQKTGQYEILCLDMYGIPWYKRIC